MADGPSMEDVLNGGGHKDATFHLAGTKVIVLTDDSGQTWLCRRDDGVRESATPMGRVEALQVFAAALAEVLDSGDVTPRHHRRDRCGRHVDGEARS
ncbi:hypothetical protein [Thermomonospora cellulosilytica]|uniref:Uncharacterized protein n=1 Tax=Thermomonospora cellulosilytica TaxID=1411118 RepID=A0A7W3MV34_9ACTN|nr:hypothetical protein [Thermomonospora cellulosilytica]MBA9002453.1 hypothetical protein [Thermomonospora cellulosilytica]